MGHGAELPNELDAWNKPRAKGTPKTLFGGSVVGKRITCRKRRDDCFEEIEQSLRNKKPKQQNDEENKNLIDIIGAAKTAHSESTNLYLKSNTAIQNQDAKRIARKQSNIILDAVKFGEKVEHVNGIMQYHNETMIGMYKTIHDNTGKNLEKQKTIDMFSGAYASILNNETNYDKSQLLSLSQHSQSQQTTSSSSSTDESDRNKYPSESRMIDITSPLSSSSGMS